jgi:hypothetical protein
MDKDNALRLSKLRLAMTAKTRDAAKLEHVIRMQRQEIHRLRLALSSARHKPPANR